MTSQAAVWIALAATALALSCATTKSDARWEMRESDYSNRGMTAEAVARWEDGYHTPKSGAEYEWWYFDGLLEDGTTVVVWFGNRWPPGEEGWRVNLEITPPKESGRPVITETFRQKTADFVSETEADVLVKKNIFKGDLDRYHIVVDLESASGSGVDLWLTRRVPSWRPGTGHFGDRKSYFAWVVAVPEGRVEGTITEHGKTRSVSGSGYHDHNWGNVTPDTVMAGWWWGRAAVGEYTVVAADLRAAKAFGSDNEPLLLVTGPRGVVTSLVGKSALDVEYLPLGPNPDINRKVPFGTGVIFKGKTDPVTASIRATDTLLSSTDMLESAPRLKATIARVLGIRPWYTRVLANYAVDLNGAVTTHEGTLEYMDFDERR